MEAEGFLSMRRLKNKERCCRFQVKYTERIEAGELTSSLSAPDTAAMDVCNYAEYPMRSLEKPAADV